MLNKSIKRNLTILAVFIIIFLMNNVSADVISVNGGGDGFAVSIPSQEIEGFFFGEEDQAEVTPQIEQEGGGRGRPHKGIPFPWVVIFLTMCTLIIVYYDEERRKKIKRMVLTRKVFKSQK